jgi:hypothetical protein
VSHAWSHDLSPASEAIEVGNDSAMVFLRISRDKYS